MSTYKYVWIYKNEQPNYFDLLIKNMNYSKILNCMCEVNCQR